MSDRAKAATEHRDRRRSRADRPKRRPSSISARRRYGIGCRALLTSMIAAVLIPAEPVVAQTRFLPDAVGAEYGYHDDIGVYAISARWRVHDNPDWLAARNLEPRIDAQLGYWRSRVADTAYPALWNVGVKGVLRWSPPASGMRPFAEVGVGGQLQSQVHIYNRDLGIAFQFASRAALGVALLDDHSVEIGAFVEHVSNGRLARPNDGLTYAGVVMRVNLP